MSKVIISCFAGRRRYMKILSKYINILINKGLVDEFHIWDFSWEIDDEIYLEELARFDKTLLMKPNNKKSWGEYYRYYTRDRFPDPDTVIIKCDDDIVFIDTDAFSDFIAKRREDRCSLLHSASVVNGSVTSLIQNHHDFLPKDKFSESDLLHILHSDTVPAMIHDFFLANSCSIIENARQLRGVLYNIDINYPTQLSINFVAILAKDLDLFQSSDLDIHDEEALGLNMPKALGRCNTVNMGFIVCHSAFLGQRLAGFDDSPYLEKYANLLPVENRIERFEGFNYLTTKFSKTELKPLLDEIRNIQSENFGTNTDGAASLAGHMKKQFFLQCKDFMEDLLLPHANSYEKANPVKYKLDFFDGKLGDYYLDSLWVNFQEKYEFNPIHDHNGVLSFVIWISIPYDLSKELEIFPNSNRRRTSLFEFVLPHHSNKSNITTVPIQVDKSYEGTMILFPSYSSHTVYPFYTSDDYRISVSGNFKFRVESK